MAWESLGFSGYVQRWFAATSTDDQGMLTVKVDLPVEVQETAPGLEPRRQRLETNPLVLSSCWNALTPPGDEMFLCSFKEPKTLTDPGARGIMVVLFLAV